jgi:hypothetical protein
MALEALETYSKPGRCDCCGSQGDCATSCEARGIIESLRAALAQPDAEPYGWKVEAVSRLYMGRHAELDAKAEAAHCGGTCKAFPLYAAPQPAPVERKPLTDEQILNVARDHYNPHQRPEISFARAIEAAHNIKAAP